MQNYANKHKTARHDGSGSKWFGSHRLTQPNLTSPFDPIPFDPLPRQYNFPYILIILPLSLFPFGTFFLIINFLFWTSALNFPSCFDPWSGSSLTQGIWPDRIRPRSLIFRARGSGSKLRLKNRSNCEI